MATVSFTNLNNNFDMVASNDTSTGWTPSSQEESHWVKGENRFDVKGTFGMFIPVSGGYAPFGGTIFSASVDLGNNNLAAPDIVITGASADASSTYSNFWTGMLAGDDTFDLGASFLTKGIAGDGVVANAGVNYLAGRDSFVGNAGSSFVIGDFETVAADAFVSGGDDIISVSALSIYGDSRTVSGNLIGGDDRITAVSGPIVASAWGDAYQVSDASRIIGGNDDITVFGEGSAWGDAQVVGASSVAEGGNDRITGGSGASILYGDFQSIGTNTMFRFGDDTLFGGGGADTLYGDSELLLSATGGNDRLYGGTNADKLFGSGGNDILDGGSGSDQMDGGEGDDTFYVDSADDAVTEGVNGGIDLVVASRTYVLGANLENLTLAGTAANATGNALANSLTGNSSANRLDGGGEADTMTGGAGSDT